MALTTLTIACFLFYRTSRYFPMKETDLIKEHKSKILILASAIAFFSLFLFARSFDFATALMIWMIAFMTLLSAIILSVKMDQRWMWIWGALSVLFIFIDLF